MKEPKFFAPTNDFVFKMIFGDERNIDILADFLQAVLDLPHHHRRKEPFLPIPIFGMSVSNH